MRAAISSHSFPSEMQLIVEQCVAQVREAAGLASAEESISIPPLKKGPPPLPKAPLIPVDLEFSNAQLGVAPTLAWDDAVAAAPWDQPAPLPPPAVVVASGSTPSAARAAMRWPLFVCAFIAGVTGGAAFIKSPLGHTPSVRHVVTAVQSQAAHVVASIRATH